MIELVSGINFNSGTNLPGFKDRSLFKAQAVLFFYFDLCKMFSLTP
jgi:hypothetical protein